MDAPAYKAHITNKEKLLELNITYYDFIKQVKFDLYYFKFKRLVNSSVFEWIEIKRNFNR